MPPTLAELRAQTGPKPLPKGVATVTLIEGQHLLTKAEQLQQQYDDLRLQADRDAEKAETDGRARTRKAGQKSASPEKRLEQIKAEIEVVVDELVQYQSEVGLRGIEGGEWQRYKDAHPPREDNRTDMLLTGGRCDASDLFDDLARFVATWEGDDLKDGDWNGWLAERICYADRAALVTAVVNLHETRMPRSPKLPTASPSTETSGTD